MAEIWNNCLPPVFTSSLNVTLRSYIYSFWTDVKLWPLIIVDFLHRQACCHSSLCFLDLHIYTSASHAALGRASILILRISSERKWYHFLPFVGWNRQTLKFLITRLTVLFDLWISRVWHCAHDTLVCALMILSSLLVVTLGACENVYWCSCLHLYSRRDYKEAGKFAP